MLNDERIDSLYEAAVQCVEESVLNAIVAARDMGGSEGDRPRDAAEIVPEVARPPPPAINTS
jgi:L-aminopeptidase/D-esterase-like protein